MPRRPRREKEPPVPVTYELSPDVESVMARVTRLYPDQFSWSKNFTLGAVIVRGSKPKEATGKSSPWDTDGTSHWATCPSAEQLRRKP